MARPQAETVPLSRTFPVGGGGGGYGGGGYGGGIKLPPAPPAPTLPSKPVQFPSGSNNIVPFRLPPFPRLPQPPRPFPSSNPVPQESFLPRLPRLPSIPRLPSMPNFLPFQPRQERPNEELPEEVEIPLPQYQQPNWATPDFSFPSAPNLNYPSVPAPNPNGLYKVTLKLQKTTYLHEKLPYFYEESRYRTDSRTYQNGELSVTAFGRDLEYKIESYNLSSSTAFGFFTVVRIGDINWIAYSYNFGYYINPDYSQSIAIEKQTPYDVVVEPITSSPSPATRPDFQNQTNTEEEEMSCRCYSPDDTAMMFRALRQTITVEATTVTKMPTGDLVAIPQPQVVSVLALPGTTSSWSKLFQQVSESKKRIAEAFNQARKSRLMGRLIKTMQVAHFLLDVHNAAMISRDLGQSFFSVVTSTIDNAVKFVDDLPFVGNLFEIDDSFSSQQAIGSALDNMAKTALGESSWEAFKAKWAALNRITAHANTMLMSIRDLSDSTTTIAALGAEVTSKFANQARKDGLLSDDGKWYPENYSKQSAFRQKIQSFEEGAQGLLNAAEYVEQLTGTLVQSQENYKQFKENKEAFEKSLKEDLPKVTAENEKIKASADSSKTDSQSPTISPDDLKKP